jgi:phosphoribosylcarboxyaminoimidazole (NCAIR) mutase
MPAGVPVATMAIGKAGAANAAIFAAQILARKEPQISARLVRLKKEMASGVAEKDRKLRTERQSR